MPEAIISTWVIGDTYHTLSLNIYIGYLDLIKRKDITGTGGVILIFPGEEIMW